MGALPGPGSSSSNQYLATGRPGSSLGISGSNTNANGTRARRVTIEEKYRMEREREAELDGNTFLGLLACEWGLLLIHGYFLEYERRKMEDVAEQERM